MTGITDPSEEYFKDGLWAWVTDQWKKLVADASSFLQVNVAAQDIDVEVKQTSPADLTPGIMGWDGSAWHKQPLLWGYSDRWTGSGIGTASDAGNAVAATTAVPAGYVYVIQAFHFNHNATSAKKAVVRVEGSGNITTLFWNAAVAPSVQTVWSGVLTLAEGDTITATLYAPGDGKKMYLGVWGYKMKVAE